SMASIHSLPNELLLAVFHYLVQDALCDGPTFALTRYTKMPLRVDTSQLIAITHVCHRWRSVATTYPRFWTRVDGHHATQIVEFRARSLSLPLSLYLDSREPATVSLPALGHRQFQLNLYTLLLVWRKTVRRLDMVERVYPASPDPPDWLVSLSMPTLQVLNLAVVVDEEPDDLHLRRIVLLGDPVSSLKALAVSGITAWTPANHFPSLTHLYLSFDYVSGITSSDILSVLANTPCLEYLHFRWLQYFPDLHGIVGLTILPPPVRLPRLRSLLLTDCADDFIRLFKLLELPSHVPIRLHNSQICSVD
ncbi:uncharacterized protein BXZ73DRAFT_4076, partial [Epithele typhae]|uniref:uncharacterized protein n=1 Tax=Epithele typhae TaxID=378194 RepID=UPI0020084B08